MQLLTFSSLFPSEARPHHGIFVETRLRELLASGEVTTRVVCPVPWFPSKLGIFGEYADYARVSRRETRHGVEVLYPRFPLLPRAGMSLAPILLAAWMKPVLKRILDSGYRFELIDAHYFYPDGVAAVMLGRWLDRPVVVTARGTDVNLIPRYALPRRMIRWAGNNSAAIITVCEALKDRLGELGVDKRHVTVLRNGVDLERFSPVSRDGARNRLGVRATTLLSVGHLIERKGHHIVIEALRHLPGVNLIVVGDGELSGWLQAVARSSGVSERVRFAGAVGQKELRDYYSAADALVLASSREGMANVLLEAMACGTPVVATNIWGTPEVVSTPESGVLMRERTASACADAVRTLLDHYPDREATRGHASRFGWEDTTHGQLVLFRRVLSEQAGGERTVLARHAEE